MLRNAAIRAIGFALALATVGCARSMERYAPRGLPASGDPVFIRGLNEGLEARGPHCRAPFNDRAYDRECGIVYAIDTSGHYRQIRERRDAHESVDAGHLALAPDGHTLYGTASVVGLGESGARPVIYRIGVDGTDFAIVHRFASSERVLGIDDIAIDRASVVFAYVTVGARRNVAEPALVRIADSRAEMLARFGNAQTIGPPLLARNGNVGVVLADRASCARTFAYLEPLHSSAHRYASGELPVRGGCRRATNGRTIASADGRTLTLLARRLESHTRGGRSLTEVDLPEMFGHFAGGLVAGAHDTSYTLAAGSNGGVCMRLVRIRDGGVDVLHTFRRDGGWCLPPSLCVFPHVRISPLGFDLTTPRGRTCATGVRVTLATDFDGAFASVAHVAPGGAVRFAFASDD